MNRRATLRQARERRRRLAQRQVDMQGRPPVVSPTGAQPRARETREPLPHVRLLLRRDVSADDLAALTAAVSACAGELLVDVEHVSARSDGTPFSLATPVQAWDAPDRVMRRNLEAMARLTKAINAALQAQVRSR